MWLSLSVKLGLLRKATYYPLVLAVLGGITMALGWYFPLTPLLFVGLVPFFELTSLYFEHKQIKQYWLYVWLYFSIWNLGVYWWLWNAVGLGLIGIILLNAFLQLLPIIFYTWTRRFSGGFLNYFALISWWLFFEYVHLNWVLSFPWMNLGNALGEVPAWVQWYEYTGVLGGSLWVLLANLAAYRVFVKQDLKVGAWAALVLTPILFSIGIYQLYEESPQTTEMVVVQPNLDCYDEKFAYNPKTGEAATHYVPYDQQIKRYLHLAKTVLTDSTDYIIFPETAFHENVAEDNYLHNSFLAPVLDFIQTHQVTLITGADTYKFYKKNESIPKTARKTKNGEYYNTFNTAIQITPTQQVDFYHKSKLVIGAETNPIKMILPKEQTEWLLFVDIMGSLGTQDKRSVFKNPNTKAKIAPVICWEAVFGEFCTEYIQAGANVIVVPTNEGWWGDTPAPRQLWGLSALRAIETRRSVVRAANTGISGFINEKGQSVLKSEYGQQIALRSRVTLNEKLTFYTQHGDYLGRLAGFLAILFFIQAFTRKIRNK